MKRPSEGEMGRWFIFSGTLGLVGACAAAPEKDGDTGSVSVATDCVPETAPQIDGLSIEAVEGDPPSLWVELSASDEDGDLSPFEVHLWFDQVVDGDVEQGEDNLISPGPVQLDVADCGATAITSEIEIVMLGEDVLEYQTLYEFAVVITDGAGLASPVAITTAQTPQ
jgi:hypothetical protein